jgi:murein DD-endopeptidase MepM/ murein hydrolase activator NlpD
LQEVILRPLRKFATVLLAIFFLFSLNVTANAISTSVDDEVQAAQEDLNAASEVVKEAAAELKEVQAKLPAAEAALRQARQELGIARDDVARAEALLAELEAKLGDTQYKYETNLGFVGDVARDLYLQGPLSTLDILLNSTDPNDFTQSMMSMQSYLESQDRVLKDLAAIQATLQAEQDAVTQQKIELEGILVVAEQAAARAKQAEQEVQALIDRQQAALKKAEKEREAIRQRYEDLRKEQERLRQLARLRGGFSGDRPGELFWPITGARLSQGVGPRRHPVFGYRSCHTGIDLAAPTGTPIFATASGVVTTATTMRAYGNVVIMYHGGGMSSMYAHMSRFNTSSGSAVAVGDVIGYVGSTGWSTGPHLHFEVHIDGVPYNPLGWFGGSKDPVRC